MSVCRNRSWSFLKQPIPEVPLDYFFGGLSEVSADKYMIQHFLKRVFFPGLL